MISTRYAGLIVVVALVMGGGTAQGLWTDHLLQLLALPALLIGLAGFWSNRLDTGTRILIILILGIVAVQFMPVWRPIPLIDQSGLSFWSPAPQKSLESALFTIAGIGFFLYVAMMCDQDRERLIPYFYVGLFAQAAIAVVQLSFSQRVILTGVLPFDATTGLFANENHFSTLFFAMIPLLAYSLVIRAEKIWAFVLVSLVLVGIMFAVGSRAGMAISSAVSLLCLIWFLPVGNKQVAKIGGLAVGGTSAVLAVLIFGSGTSLEGDQRWILFSTTIEAIQDHWLTGSGLGTFMLIYPNYEDAEQVIQAFANHTHNDYLEILLEIGLGGAVIILSFFLLISRGIFRSPLSEAAFLSLVALCLHSIVDYPMRTMALAMVFAFLAASVSSRRE